MGSRRRDWEVLATTTAAFFLTMIARLAPSPLVPEVIDTFAVSKSTVGIALSGMWAAYALFQFPGGVLVDRLGARRVILLAIGATGLASAALAAAPAFPLFAAAAVALGAGAGLYFPAGSGLLTARFDDTGRALGVHEIGASAAGLVAPVASAAVAVRFGWRAGLLVPVAVAAVVGSLFAWRVPETPPAEADQPVVGRLDADWLGALLARPAVLFTTLLATLGFFTWQSFASFFPTFLVEYAGLPTGRASVVFGAIFAITVVGAPALGWASDVVGRDSALVASFSAGACGYLAFLFVGGTAGVLGGTALLGVGLSWPGVVNSRFMDHLAADERGTGFGFLRTLLLLVSSLGSAVTGTLAGRANWLVAYGSVAGLLALLVALLVATRGLGIDA